MAGKRDTKKPAGSLSQPSFSASSAVNVPPHSGPVSNPLAKSESAERVQSAPDPSFPAQRPVRWVYNDDHTDPLNFGFMFPVPVDTPTPAHAPTPTPTPTSAAQSSLNTPLETSSTSPSTGQWKASAVSPIVSGSSSGTIGNAAFLPARHSPAPNVEVVQQSQFISEGFQHQSQQHTSLTPQDPSNSFYQDQSSIHYGLPRRNGPYREIPLDPSAQEFTSPQGQAWYPTQSTTIPHLIHGGFLDSQQWLQNERGDFSHSYFHPVSSGQTLTPDFTVTAPAPMKRKRDSDFSSQVATPHFNVAAIQRLISKGRNSMHGDPRPGSLLCSRCQIYERISNVPGLCSSCLQISFNTWPSALGSRRENLESLVLFLMPSNMEEVLMLAPPHMPRVRSWRMLPQQTDLKEYDFSTLVFQDRWTLSKQQAESTRLFGEDYEELANIAQLYQLSLPRPNKSLEASCTVLITVCELYKSFVTVTSSSSISQTISIPKLINNTRTARITIRHAFQQLQLLALSPSDSRDRQDWFPAFLSACIMACTAVIFLDILVACPPPYKEQIWGSSWHDRIVEMRNGGYGMLIAVLKANSKGVNPLKMGCWTDDTASPDPFINFTPESYSPEVVSPNTAHGNKKRRKTSKAVPEDVRQKSMELEAERERNLLLGMNSPAALQGVLALKAWYLKYSDHLKQGEDMFSKSLYRLATMQPVAGLWRIFELQ